MSNVDELARLADLRRNGALSDHEFEQAKARLLGESDLRRPPSLAEALNGLRRSSVDRWLGGVCGGLAESTGMASWLWRLGFTLLALFGGMGFLAYLLMWIFVPSGAGMPPRGGSK